MLSLEEAAAGLELAEVDRRGPAYVRWLQASLNRVGGARLGVDGRMGPRTTAAVRAFQSRRGLVADGLAGPRTEAALIAAGAPKPPKAAPGPRPRPGPRPGPAPSKRYPDVNTNLPTPGSGYASSSASAKQYGIPETIRAIRSIGTSWFGKHPGGPRVVIGDISLQGGGPIKGHVSHQRGIDFDVRPMRKDGREGPILYTDAAYSRPLTQELVDAIRSNGVLKVQYIFFNDSAVRGVKHWPKHDNHLHVRFFPPVRSGAAGVQREAAPAGDRRNPAYVRWLQASLNKVVGAGLSVDGRTGPRTVAAVKTFQRRVRLPADGVVSPRLEAALARAAASAPPRPGAPPARPGGPSAVGALIKREERPPRVTLYFNIVLGGEPPAQAMTGVFIPEKYQLSRDTSGRSRLDLLVYLHGYKRTEPALAIDGYWKAARHPEFALREGVNDSHKNLVMVAPTLGPRAQAGRLAGPGGLDRYLDQVMACLARSGPWAEAGLRPYVGDVILACHSGGGLPMRTLATGGGKYAAAVRECWGFDSLYNKGDAEIWARWAGQRPQARLYVHYQSSTATQSGLLKAKAVPNVSVERSHARSHDWVPITHWAQRLQQAAFLRTR